MTLPQPTKIFESWLTSDRTATSCRAVQKRTIAGCELAVAIVQPSDAPPVRYKGRVWIRVGPRRDIASDEEERRLNEKRRAHDLSFDLHPLPSADLDEFDIDLFEREYIPNVEGPTSHQNGRSVEEKLASVRFATPGPEFTPTVLGVLTIGIDPRRYVPGAYVQFLRVDGTELGDPIKDQSEIDGPLPEMLSRLDEKLRAHLEVSSDFVSGDREQKHQNYPLPALQQLARNAVLHRDYDSTGAPVRITWFNDRIEINNPGGPYGQVTKDNFGQPGVTDYRNPHLAEVMKTLGYVQRFGAGIPTARRALEENGNPLPDFTQTILPCSQGIFLCRDLKVSWRGPGRGARMGKSGLFESRRPSGALCSRRPVSTKLIWCSWTSVPI